MTPSEVEAVAGDDGLTPLAKARAIVIQNLDPEAHKHCSCRARIVAGQWDNTLAIRSVLATIAHLERQR